MLELALGEPSVPETCWAATWLTIASELARHRNVLVMDRKDAGDFGMFRLP
jgi:hypothetical protein